MVTVEIDTREKSIVNKCLNFRENVIASFFSLYQTVSSPACSHFARLSSLKLELKACLKSGLFGNVLLYRFSFSFITFILHGYMYIFQRVG